MDFAVADVMDQNGGAAFAALQLGDQVMLARSEEHTSERQSPVPISYAVFCLKKKTNI